jgi:hypothetical protein
MDTIEHYLHSFVSIVAHNFLAIGVTIIVFWLLVSGLRKGLKKSRGEKDPHENDEEDHG